MKIVCCRGITVQAHENRRMMRQEEVVQGVYHMKAQNLRGGKDNKNNKWMNILRALASLVNGSL